MFEDSFIESRNRFKRRGWATVASFAIQALIIVALVLIPLLVTQALPTEKLMTTLVAPPPPPPPPPPPSGEAKTTPTHPQPTAVKPEDPNELRAPVKIPERVEKVKEVTGAAAPSVAGVTGGVPGGVAGGQLGGVVGGVIGSIPTAVPKLVAPQRVRVSQGVSEGLLTHKVMPEYPAVAKQARVQGQVLLQALISKDGKIENVQVVSGPPMLAQAAVNAVRQWRYKPYMLNGQPTEVETMITVNFKLGNA